MFHVKGKLVDTEPPDCGPLETDHLFTEKNIPFPGTVSSLGNDIIFFVGKEAVILPKRSRKLIIRMLLKYWALFPGIKVILSYKLLVALNCTRQQIIKSSSGWVVSSHSSEESVVSN